MRVTILVVGGSIEFTAQLRTFLEQRGYTIVQIGSSSDAVNYLYAGRRADSIVLDVQLPDTDGWEMCSRLRGLTDAPIVVIAAGATERDVVDALNAGADDFVAKPVRLGVLKARLDAHLRRARLSGRSNLYPAYADSDLYVDLRNQEIRLRGQFIALTPTEFRLLACLVRHAGHVVAHEELLSEVWGGHRSRDADTVKLYVRYLRQKIEPDPCHPRYVVNVWGKGYRFCNTPPL